MSTLLYFLLIAGVFFLMMRFGCGAHVMGHGHGDHGGHGDRNDHDASTAGGGAPPPLQSAVDPVCSMSVDIATAKSSVYRGRTYYFCSAEHREQFEAAPERYAGASAGPANQPKEHSHGC
ncbi:MAG: YHS domain-containing protein [Burkholderiales bacterium]